MQLKLKLAAIGSAVGIAASMGVVFAGPAAAAQDVHMCIVDSKGAQNCAETYPTIHDSVNLVTNIDNSSPWDTPGKKGEISVPEAGLCMQFHTSDTIWLNSCTGVSSEEWTAEAGKSKGTTVFKSVYNTAYCLNADPYLVYPLIPDVNVAKCSTSNVNQEWYQTA